MSVNYAFSVKGTKFTIETYSLNSNCYLIEWEFSNASSDIEYNIELQVCKNTHIYIWCVMTVF